MANAARSISDMSPSEISAIVRPMATPQFVGVYDFAHVVATLHEELRHTFDFRRREELQEQIIRIIDWEASL